MKKYCNDCNCIMEECVQLSLLNCDTKIYVCPICGKIYVPRRCRDEKVS